MPLLLPRQDLAGIEDTFSSWDKCMSESYCKWPVIAAIIIGSVVVLSIIWCCARCLCCGAECCCGCLSCFNSCCPSPRKNRKDGYEQPMQPQFQPYPQYGQPAPMMYGPPPTHNPTGPYGNRGATTATVDAPSIAKSPTTYNEDALPPMPSWGAATSRQIDDNDVEMARLNDGHAAQEESLLARNDGNRYYLGQERGDLGGMAASPHYNDHKTNPYDATSPHSPQEQTNLYRAPSSHYTSASPAPSVIYAPQPVNGFAGFTPGPPASHYSAASPPPSTVYSPVQAYPGQQRAYEPSLPPYTTAPPSVRSPPPHASIERKPVQGSWRDI